MSFGITLDGFTIKRLSDILEEIEADETAAFGTLDHSASSVITQLNGTFSKQCSDIWEVLQSSYLSSSPSNAEGLSLDYVVAQNNIERLSAISTLVEVALRGSNGTVIPEGTQISSTVDGELFSLSTDFTLSSNSLQRVYLTINNVLDSTIYTVTINGIDIYQYTSSGSATANEIVTGLETEINLDSGAVIIPDVLPDGVLQITTKAAVFDITFDSNIDKWNIAEFASDVKDEINAIANTLTVIETPVSGLDQVQNYIDGVKGRGPETDPELRTRRLQSLQITGAGTLPAMIARVLNDVDGVTAVNGYENREDYVDGDGRQPHSFELVVQGGLDQDIYDKIWEVKPAGIQTFGNTAGTITDSNGEIQAINFSRPVNQYAWMICDYTLYNEEIFPTDGAQQIEDQILLTGDSLGIGKDIIPQRFHGPIYEIPGIQNLSIQIAVTATPGGTPSYTTAIIPIDADEISVWDPGRVTVNEV